MLSCYSVKNIREYKMDILTLNCGSSSAKYQLYRWDSREVLSKGIVERIGLEGSLIDHYAKGKGGKEIPSPVKNHKEAIELIIKTLLDSEIGAITDINEIKAVGHRVVHGGEKFTKSVIIDDDVIKTFEELADLAPLHNPPNVTGIKAAKEELPNVPHCAIMDTAWHQSMPEHAFIYALPYEWYEDYGVRRYGFHGTSFLYVSKRASVILGKDPFETSLICLHIGNGVSANAVKNGFSVDTSMGLTPLEGLVMGTRAGDHDAAIGYYIMGKEGLSAKEVETILNKKSGVLGITGKYTDRRDIRDAAGAGDKRAKLAMDIECYRIRKYVGSYNAALGKVDAIVFTAGVGENESVFRGHALDGLEDLGIIYDKRKNELATRLKAEMDITGEGSKVRILVIPTDEELVMTEDTYALIEGNYDVHSNFTYSFQKKDYVNKAKQEALKAQLDGKSAEERKEIEKIIL